MSFQFEDWKIPRVLAYRNYNSSLIIWVNFVSNMWTLVCFTQVRHQIIILWWVKLMQEFLVNWAFIFLKVAIIENKYFEKNHSFFLSSFFKFLPSTSNLLYNKMYVVSITTLEVGLIRNGCKTLQVRIKKGTLRVLIKLHVIISRF